MYNLLGAEEPPKVGTVRMLVVYILVAFVVYPEYY